MPQPVEYIHACINTYVMKKKKKRFKTEFEIEKTKFNTTVSETEMQSTQRNQNNKIKPINNINENKTKFNDDYERQQQHAAFPNSLLLFRKIKF